MKNINLVILDGSEEFAGQLKSCLELNEQLSVCGVSGNGNVGISLINQFKPDVVVLNLVLSGMDGFGVMDYIRQNKLNCAIIVVSNFSDEKIVNAAIAKGAILFCKTCLCRNGSASHTRRFKRSAVV